MKSKKYLLDVMALYRQRPDLKAYLELLLSIGAIALFVLFAIKPTLVTISDLWIKIKSQQITSDQLSVKITNLGLAQIVYNKEKTNIDLLKTSIPSDPSIASYVRQIEGLIKKDNVTAISISVNEVNLLNQNASASSELLSEKSVPLTVSVSGNYQSLLTFLQDLESLRRPSIIKKLDLNTTQLNDEVNTINLSVSSSVPYN